MEKVGSDLRIRLEGQLEVVEEAVRGFRLLLAALERPDWMNQGDVYELPNSASAVMALERKLRGSRRQRVARHSGRRPRSVGSAAEGDGHRDVRSSILRRFERLASSSLIISTVPNRRRHQRRALFSVSDERSHLRDRLDSMPGNACDCANRLESMPRDAGTSPNRLRTVSKRRRHLFESTFVVKKRAVRPSRGGIANEPIRQGKSSGQVRSARHGTARWPAAGRGTVSTAAEAVRSAARGQTAATCSEAPTWCACGRAGGARAWFQSRRGWGLRLGSCQGSSRRGCDCTGRSPPGRGSSRCSRRCCGTVRGPRW